MRILGIERDNTACNHYRVLQPLVKLGQHRLADCLTIKDSQLGSNEAIEKVMGADIIVFQRPASEEWFNFIKICQAHGKIIVCDYDDDPFNTSPLNPYYKFIGIQEYEFEWPDGSKDMLWKDGVDGFSIDRNIQRQDLFNASFRKADMVTTTTDILQGFFNKLNKNTVILPNLIDFNIFHRYDMKKKEVRIGYQGGSSHYEDIYMIKDQIRKVLEENEGVKFVFLGDPKFRGLFKDFPDGSIEIHRWVNFDSYPYKMPLLNIDIGLCPLVDNVFNRNKSCIKYLDYSAMGITTIASDLPPYSPVINNKKDGLLVKDGDWANAMNDLIKNKRLRKKLADNAYENVYENHNADKKVHLWKDAYESLIKQEVKI